MLYVAAVLAEPGWRGVGALIGAALVAVLWLTVGRRLHAALRDQPSAMRLAVGAYVFVISVMLFVACAAGPWLMGVGAACFVASDSLLAWNRFIAADRRLERAVMPTYHAGQVLMTLALLHQLA